MCQSADGALMANCGAYKHTDKTEINIIDINSGEIIKAVEEYKVNAMCFTSDNKCLVVCARQEIKVYGIEENTVLQTLKGHTGYITGAHFTSD